MNAHNTKPHPRRLFLRSAGLVGASLTCLGAGLALPSPLRAQDRPERPPALEPDLVREWVGVAHRDIDRVKELFAQHPTLINGTWDWGGGDFETALGAAAHTGRANIAEFLLANGARADVFAIVMLGKTALFDAWLADDPGIVNLKGPHGLSLEHHALKGGQDALAARIRELAAASAPAVPADS